MASVLWPLLLGLLACRVPIFRGCIVMSKLSPARKLCARCTDGGRSPHVCATTCCPLAHRPRLLTSAIPLFAARLALGVAATQGILDELLDQFLDKPKRLRRAFAWRFVSRPSRCSTCIRRAALP